MKNFEVLKTEVVARMKKELPSGLYYHGAQHTLDVISAAEFIGKKEGLSTTDLSVVLYAALFHDTGFLMTYENHEAAGCRIAREVLAKYNYSDEFISSICEIIMCTKYPPDPKNLPARVLCDADLDYLGRDDFFLLGEALRKEAGVEERIVWYKGIIKFLEVQKYYTLSAQQLREEGKQRNLQKLYALVNKNF